MDEYIGCIKLFAGDYEPSGYMFCDGRKLRIGDYSTLAVVLGEDHLNLNGYFNLPTLPPPTSGTHYIICVKGIFPLKSSLNN